MQRTSWNPLIPVRPRETADGQPLNYRTHIDKPNTTYDVLSTPNRLAQIKLYHWCKSIDFVNMVPINDLHQYLFGRYPQVTKRQMGRTIRQAVPYKCNVLKGVCKDNDHAQMCYVWHHREELEYGLEWMLSLWIWGIERDLQSCPLEQHSKRVIEIFEEIGALDEDEFDSEWSDLVTSGEYADLHFLPGRKMDWFDLWDKHGFREEEPRTAPTERISKLRGFAK